MLGRLAIGFLLSSTLLFPSSARASDDEPPTRSYASETLTVDALAASGMLVGFASHATPLTIVSAGAFVLGTPIVHDLHGGGGRAVGSFALRLALPLATTFAGAALGNAIAGPRSPDYGEGAPLEGATFGGIVGVVAVSAIDAALLAREPVPPPGPSVTLMPSIDPVHRTASLGVGGRF